MARDEPVTDARLGGWAWVADERWFMMGLMAGGQVVGAVSSPAADVAADAGDEPWRMMTGASSIGTGTFQ